MLALAALVATSLVPDAADGVSPSGWARQEPVTIAGIGGYSIALPPDVRGGPVQGIDSLVARYEGRGFSLDFDFGMYGARPECGRRRCKAILIDGLPATLARPMPNSEPGDPAGRRWLHLYLDMPPLGILSGTNLVVYARCGTDAGCMKALRILETIDFNFRPVPEPSS